ncbi:MAG: ABC transporter ATP-binding protein [Candidatus Dormibacteraeota bacterium]|nr:ABC transporter ATP-binding protein [Candidatus Dormibacteraeota bacterium]
MSQTILCVDGLSAEIEGHQVVEGASFEVPATGVTALLGRNGVGKTSTLRAILGLITRRGTVEYDGTRIDRLDTHRIIRLGIGYVPEDREVFAGLTVAENMNLAARGGAPRRELVDELFPDLVHRAGQRAGTLSGGQQQMLSLARVLGNVNRLLLIDEPTKGLSPRVVGEVAIALERAARSVPMLLVEQNLDVVRRLAQRVIVMESGRVVHTGPAAELLDDRGALERYLGVRSTGGGQQRLEEAR